MVIVFIRVIVAEQHEDLKIRFNQEAKERKELFKKKQIMEMELIRLQEGAAIQAKGNFNPNNVHCIKYKSSCFRCSKKNSTIRG